MNSTKRVLPHPVGPLSKTGILASQAALEQFHFITHGNVVRLDLQAELFHLPGAVSTNDLT